MIQVRHSVFEIAGWTHPGLRRRQRPNEDAVLVLAEEEKPPLLAVADGLGGYQGGAQASRVVVQSLAAFYHHQAPPTNWIQWIQAAIQYAHEQIRHQGQVQGLSHMSSTVVLALLFPQHVLVANVGDSRAYLEHQGRLIQITQDHSVVGRMIREGRLSPQAALRHPHRHRLTQSLSARRSTVQPFWKEIPWQPGDRLLLCSDGLWSVVPEALIRKVLQEVPPPDGVRRLIQLANGFSGPDNITVVVARYRPAQTAVPQPSASGADEETRP